MQQNLDQQPPKLLRKSSVFRTLATLSIVCLFVLTACGGTNGTQQTGNQIKRGGQLHVGLIAEPTVLDPLTSVTLYDADIMENMYDTLFRYDDKNQLQPDLVSSYVYNSPTLLDLKLHTGILFQDGTPFNADAVIYNLNRFINDKASPRYTDVSDITSLQKISDSELVIHLQKPFAPFLGALSGGAGYMISPTALKKLGKGFGNAQTNAGSGPFIFVEWIKGDHLLLKANPHYWRKDAQGNALPYLSSIRYRTITNGSVMFTNLETGSVQVATGISPNDVASVKSNSSLTYNQVS
ncbi:MAG: ABC transporter substrate-binding protein, partial [Ktedonobacteraceae bacterium]